ncbi:MAG: hypothetical protein R2822_05505 [Spirosomataceae bacterium]
MLNHAFSISAEASPNHGFSEGLSPSIVESMLLVSIVVQIVSGLKLFLRKRKTARGFFEKLHIRSGLYLAFFFVIHLSAIMVGRYVLNIDTNFYFGVSGLNTFPFNLFFIPYYACAILAFFGHVAAIHHSKMQQPILGLSPYFQSIAILFVGVLTTIFIFYGLTDGFVGVEIPSPYQF